VFRRRLGHIVDLSRQEERVTEGWSVDRIARRHRISVRPVRIAIGGERLPPIRFHDLRHGAATVVPCRPQAGVPAATNVISFADRRNRRGQHAG
jgi:hypothetical protein